MGPPQPPPPRAPPPPQPPPPPPRRVLLVIRAPATTLTKISSSSVSLLVALQVLATVMRFPHAEPPPPLLAIRVACLAVHANLPPLLEWFVTLNHQVLG